MNACDGECHASSWGVCPNPTRCAVVSLNVRRPIVGLLSYPKAGSKPTKNKMTLGERVLSVEEPLGYDFPPQDWMAIVVDVKTGQRAEIDVSGLTLKEQKLMIEAYSGTTAVRCGGRYWAT